MRNHLTAGNGSQGKETPHAQVRRRVRAPLRDGDLRPPRRHRVHRRRDGREMGTGGVRGDLRPHHERERRDARPEVHAEEPRAGAGAGGAGIRPDPRRRPGRLPASQRLRTRPDPCAAEGAGPPDPPAPPRGRAVQRPPGPLLRRPVHQPPGPPRGGEGGARSGLPLRGDGAPVARSGPVRTRSTPSTSARPSLPTPGST